MNTITSDGTTYEHISYNIGVPSIEVATSQPAEPQEFIAYKFNFSRDATDTTTGPILKGYQAKATIATARNEIIKFFVYCFDTEVDRYNVSMGYSGRARLRFAALKAAELNGGTVTYQDLNTGETLQVQIEQVLLTAQTPPDKSFGGFGGVLQITVRTV
jgi:hypothetical protein